MIEVGKKALEVLIQIRKKPSHYVSTRSGLANNESTCLILVITPIEKAIRWTNDLIASRCLKRCEGCAQKVHVLLTNNVQNILLNTLAGR